MTGRMASYVSVGFQMGLGFGPFVFVFVFVLFCMVLPFWAYTFNNNFRRKKKNREGFRLSSFFLFYHGGKLKSWTAFESDFFHGFSFFYFSFEKTKKKGSSPFLLSFFPTKNERPIFLSLWI